MRERIILHITSRLEMMNERQLRLVLNFIKGLHY